MEQVTATIDGTPITHVKAQSNGYRVNHSIFCPQGSRFQPNIDAWIAGGGVVEPTETVAEQKTRLHAYAAAKRERVEQSTFTYGTRKYRSTPIAVARLGVEATAAGRAVRGGLVFSTTWLDAAGNAVTLDAAGVEALQDALRAHGHESNRVYLDLKAKIDAGTVTLESEIDAAAWPS